MKCVILSYLEKNFAMCQGETMIFMQQFTNNRPVKGKGKVVRPGVTQRFPGS